MTAQKNSQTPLTDAARIDNSYFSDWGTGKSNFVDHEDMAKLEQQNAALVAALEAMVDAPYQTQAQIIESFKQARAVLARAKGDAP